MNDVDYGSKAMTEPMGILIFKLIHTGKADYTTAIASELGTNKQTVANYIKGLKSSNVINTKESNDRRQRYKADLDLLVHNWYKETKRDLENQYNQLLEMHDDRTDHYEKLIEDFEEHKDEILNFSEDYFTEIIEELSIQRLTDMSISKILTEEFTFSAMYVYLAGSEKLDHEDLYDEKWFEALYRTLMVTNVQGRTVPIMENLLNSKIKEKN
jgi:predicted transcriptional regulator